jgi:hypothetical protein
VTLGIRYEFWAPRGPGPAAGRVPPRRRPRPAAKAPEAQRAFQVFFDFNKSDITAAAAHVIQQASTA